MEGIDRDPVVQSFADLFDAITGGIKSDDFEVPAPSRLGHKISNQIILIRQTRIDKYNFVGVLVDGGDCR